MEFDVYEDKPYKNGYVSLKVTPEMNRKLCISAAVANRSKVVEIQQRLQDHLNKYPIVSEVDGVFVYEDMSLAKKLALK